MTDVIRRSAADPTRDADRTPDVGRDPRRRPGRVRRLVSRGSIIWGFLIPALLLFTYFKFIPMFAGIRMSFHDVRPFLGDEWVGWANYAAVLGDERFRSAIWHTILLGVGGSAGALVGGLALALLLEGSSKFLWLVRTAAFLPVVTATAVVAEVWRIIYYPAADGYLNAGLGLFGIEPVRFLEDPSTALMSVMVVGIWQGAPYNMVIFLAGLAAVDRSLYEAAAIDGAGVMQRLRHIVVPALRPALTIVLVLAAIRSLRVFTDVWVLTGGGPSGATEVWMTRTYSLGFERNEVGIASAASILLLVVTVVLTLATAAALRRRKDA
ncbi:carbohydrate ABC transporter permease [Microbacterium radiodurans]|uniref:Sugar ABC transporter permease n=1 Tax=Microbacterium radiodurans TaxID=661398 RepID=A0A5J5IU57_9MICO|nr:sugar ABC transporter permease [Microbacterium radiodurans]KAA9086867.1 sugar ABC transporter permease [Microbacterium radiodurans]